MKYFYWESIYDEAQTGIQDRRVYHSVICSGNAFGAFFLKKHFDES